MKAALNTLTVIYALAILGPVITAPIWLLFVPVFSILLGGAPGLLLMSAWALALLFGFFTTEKLYRAVVDAGAAPLGWLQRKAAE